MHHVENNVTAVALTTTAAQKAGLGGSLLFSSMAVFQDPAYFVIAVIGAFLSLALAWYDVEMEKRQSTLAATPFIKSVPMELLKAAGIGFLFSFVLFLSLMHFGDQLLEHFIGIADIPKVLPALSMAITLFLSTKSVKLWNGILRNQEVV